MTDSGLCSYTNPSRATIPLIRPHQCDSEGGRIRGVLLYHAHSGAMEIERQWLCFSPTMKKPYCQSCWLFGDRSAMQKEWANGVSGNPKNFGVKIKAHEKTQSHLDASIAFGRWKAGQRIDRVHEQSISTEATFWRKCLLCSMPCDRPVNVLLYLMFYYCAKLHLLLPCH